MAEDDKTIEQQIEEMASLQFTDKEIATIVGVEHEQLIREYVLNVDRGRLLAEAEVRRSMLQLAKQGSTPAQKEFMALNKQAQKGRRTPPRINSGEAP